MVKAYIASLNWTDSKNPVCLVVLTAPGKMTRILRMRVLDLPSRLLTREPWRNI